MLESVEIRPMRALKIPHIFRAQLKFTKTINTKQAELRNKEEIIEWYKTDRQTTFALGVNN